MKKTSKLSIGRNKSFAASTLFAALLILTAIPACRKTSEPPVGPDTQGGQPMIPASAGILSVRAISELGDAGDFECDLFITDSAGNQIANLLPTALTILPELDTTFSASGITPALTPVCGPFSAELLIDQSLSMEFNDPLNLRWDAAKIFMSAVTPIGAGDEMQLSTFNNYLLGLASYGSFSNNGNDFVHAADSLANVLGPGTPLYDAMYAESDSLAVLAHNANKALVVFTDGDDNESNHSLFEAIDHARDLGIKVFAIALKTGKDTDTYYVTPGSDTALFCAATQTGGSIMHTSDPAQLPAYYAGLVKQVHGGVSYYKTKWHVQLPNHANISGQRITGKIQVATTANTNIIAPFTLSFP